MQQAQQEQQQESIEEELENDYEVSDLEEGEVIVSMYRGNGVGVKLWVVCSCSLSDSAMRSRTTRSLVGGVVIELTLCNIWWFMVLCWCVYCCQVGT